MQRPSMYKLFSPQKSRRQTPFTKIVPSGHRIMGSGGGVVTGTGIGRGGGVGFAGGAGAGCSVTLGEW